MLASIDPKMLSNDERGISANEVFACTRGYASDAQPLVAQLSQRASAAECQRRIPAETLEEFERAGFFSLLVPKSFNGHQARYSDVVEVVTTLAEGCASSAWVLALFSLHGWLVSQFPEQAQREVFGLRGQCLVASPAGMGHAAVVPGGYTISGHWYWVSGLYHCAWLLLNARDVHGTFSNRYFLVPITEVSRIQCRITTGMCATGSDDIEIEEAFVPGYRTVDTTEIMQGNAPGAVVHQAELYRLPISIHRLVAASAAVGIAKSAIHHYEMALARLAMEASQERLAARRSRELAEAAIRSDAVRLFHMRQVLDFETAHNGATPEIKERLRAALVAAHVVSECRAIVQKLLDACGASTFGIDSPLERMGRDIAVLAAHAHFNREVMAEEYGRCTIGLPTTVPAI